MTLEKQQEQQFVQCFQLSMNDLKEMIKEAVKSVIPPPSTKNSNFILSASDSNPDDDLLSPKDVTRILKISSTTLWRHNKDGILKYKNKIGRKVYYSKREVYNFINNVA